MFGAIHMEVSNIRLRVEVGLGSFLGFSRTARAEMEMLPPRAAIVGVGKRKTGKGGSRQDVYICVNSAYSAVSN